MPHKIINSYAAIILPISFILSTYFFYKASKSNYVTEFNLYYERIKSIILFLCLITILIIYYSVDPGGYIQKYFGYSLMLTIILAIFGLLYLIVMLTLPDKKKNADSKSNSPPTSLFENLQKFYVYGSILFIIFLIAVTIAISTFPGGFFNDKQTSSAVMILLLITCIIWSILLAANLFPEFEDKTLTIDSSNIFKKAILALLGLTISGLIVGWLVYNISHLSGKSGTINFILNTCLILIILALVYKIIFVKTPNEKINTKKDAFFDLIINLIFYIPCMFTSLFDMITINKTASGINSGNMKTDPITRRDIYILITAILLIGIYLISPFIYNKLNLQGGKLLVNQPVYTDTVYSLGTYQDLNGSDDFDYEYAISFWIFLDAFPPNTNPSYNKFTSLLNFGNKPNVLYNPDLNTLMVTMQQDGLKDSTTNNLIEFDENGNRIIFKKDKMLLQKWSNIIINYSGGILDIFINGELVKSNTGVVPYYTLDNLTIGEENGITGGICNVVYFKNPLTRNNIFYLYNMIKNKTPPTTKESTATIIKNSTSSTSS